jgi:hypothetical protein
MSGILATQEERARLLADLASVWEEHGVSVLQRLAVTDPELAQIAYGLLPRDVFISVEQRLAISIPTSGRSCGG